jgi:hypothetical protein
VSKLRRRWERPWLHRFSDGALVLTWSDGSSDGSQSPSSSHILNDQHNASTRRLLRNLAEALELPGEPVDYHFAIQSVVTALRPHRSDDAAIFAEMERLCWLDVQLIRAFPAAVSLERDGEKRFFKIEAFSLLTETATSPSASSNSVGHSA